MHWGLTWLRILFAKQLVGGQDSGAVDVKGIRFISPFLSVWFLMNPIFIPVIIML